MDTASLFNVSGKVVLITGGGKGIGKMIATGFVTAGSNRVYITGREEKALAATAAELNELGPGKCFYIASDLQKLEGVEKIVAELSSKEKVLNVLVNNSGNNWGEDLDTYPDEAWTKVFTLNLQRVFTMIQKCIPLLTASVGGESDGPWSDPARVINIGSVNGVSVPRMEMRTYAYSASKAGLHHLSRVLALELGRRGITVNTLACGPFATKMMAATLASAGDIVVAGVPLARIGNPADVAGTCLFLSSRAGSFINGVVLPLDGGSLTAGGNGNANL